MQHSKADIISQLRQQLEPVQARRTMLNGIPVEAANGPMRIRFPNNVFAYSAIHEFLAGSNESLAATSGFLSALLATLMKNEGIAIWISPAAQLFPPALLQYGVKPEHIIFLHPTKQNDILWALEESLKYEGLSAVVAELPNLSFAQSRRLQLAVEQSGVMGMVIRNEKMLQTTASVSRWRITHAHSELHSGMPGVGFACWQADLLRMRGKKPTSWQVAWRKGKFHEINSQPVQVQKSLLQTG